MTLERTLTELETLVEYGCGYLLSRNIKNIHPLDILPQMHQSDILTYTIGNFSYDEILDEMNECDVNDEICTWIRSNLHFGEIGFNDEDIKDYVAENWDVDDVFDDYDIKDCVRDNFDIEDVYGDDEIADRVHDVVDDMSLNEFLDMKDMNNADVLDCLPNSSITDYVAERFNVDDVYDADEILNNMDTESITDYVSRKIAIEDMVKWR